MYMTVQKVVPASTEASTISTTLTSILGITTTIPTSSQTNRLSAMAASLQLVLARFDASPAQSWPESSAAWPQMQQNWYSHRHCSTGESLDLQQMLWHWGQVRYSQVARLSTVKVCSLQILGRWGYNCTWSTAQTPVYGCHLGVAAGTLAIVVYLCLTLRGRLWQTAECSLSWTWHIAEGQTGRAPLSTRVMMWLCRHDSHMQWSQPRETLISGAYTK